MMPKDGFPHIPPISDEEEAKIQRQIADDPDTWEATEEEVASSRPFGEAFPELAAAIRRTRGPQRAPKKVPVSLRLSPEVLDYYKAQGPGWQTSIDDALKKAAGIK